MTYQNGPFSYSHTGKLPNKSNCAIINQHTITPNIAKKAGDVSQKKHYRQETTPRKTIGRRGISKKTLRYHTGRICDQPGSGKFPGESYPHCCDGGWPPKRPHAAFQERRKAPLPERCGSPIPNLCLVLSFLEKCQIELQSDLIRYLNRHTP